MLSRQSVVQPEVAGGAGDGHLIKSAAAFVIFENHGHTFGAEAFMKLNAR